MREQLLGYLLGALEPDERREVESALAGSALLRAELESLRTNLKPLEFVDEIYEPPAMLSERTCDVIFQHDWLPEIQSSEMASETSAYPEASVFDPGLLEADEFARCWNDDLYAPAGDIRPADRRRPGANPSRRTGRLGERLGRFDGLQTGAAAFVRQWSLADFVVASGVFVAAALLFFPAIANSRAMSQLTTCQNHLVDLNRGLEGYVQANHGQFPAIAESGNLAVAGIYGPTLVDAEYVDSARVLICPGSPWADPESGWRATTLEEVAQAKGATLLRLQRMMGGGYAYTLGYVSDGRYRSTQNLGRAYFAVLADAGGPVSWGAGASDQRSGNHGNRGENMLYEDGSIRLIVWPIDNTLPDNPFVNRRGQVAAGLDVHDAVLGASDTPPLALPASSGQ